MITLLKSLVLVALSYVGAVYALSGKQLEILSEVLGLFSEEFSAEFEKNLSENVAVRIPKIRNLYHEWRSLQNATCPKGQLSSVNLIKALSRLHIRACDESEAIKWLIHEVPTMWTYLGPHPGLPLLTPPLFRQVNTVHQDPSKDILIPQDPKPEEADKGKFLFFHHLRCGRNSLLDKQNCLLLSLPSSLWPELFWHKLHPTARIYALNILMKHLAELPQIPRLYDIIDSFRGYFLQWARLFSFIISVSPSEDTGVQKCISNFWEFLESEVSKSIYAWTQVEYLLSRTHSITYNSQSNNLLRDLVLNNIARHDPENDMDKPGWIWYKGTIFEEIEPKYQQSCYRVFADSQASLKNQTERMGAQPEDYKRTGEVFVAFYRKISEMLSALSDDVKVYKSYLIELPKGKSSFLASPENTTGTRISFRISPHKGEILQDEMPNEDADSF